MPAFYSVWNFSLSHNEAAMTSQGPFPAFPPAGHGSSLPPPPKLLQ